MWRWRLSNTAMSSKLQSSSCYKKGNQQITRHASFTTYQALHNQLRLFLNLGKLQSKCLQNPPRQIHSPSAGRTPQNCFPSKNARQMSQMEHCMTIAMSENKKKETKEKVCRQHFFFAFASQALTFLLVARRGTLTLRKMSVT